MSHIYIMSTSLSLSHGAVRSPTIWGCLSAWRHLYVLVVLLGFALVSSGRTALTLAGTSPSILEKAYVAAFGSFLISAVSAGLISVWNFRVAWLLGPPVDRTIEGFAIGSPVDRFHLELGREFMRAAAENREVADRKFRLLVWNFRLLILALILGLSVGALHPLLPGGAL
jgi:hypothetical protein